MTCPMSADEHAENLASLERYLILAAVVLRSSLYSTALLTTSTILPQMQGAMSATQDEIAWAMTFNILATAVVTPMTGRLVARFGAKRVMTLGIPVVGPVLGGYLAEAYTWRWAFHMLVPVGILAYLGLRLALPADGRPSAIELDWTGFLALAAAMAALQLVLARGVRLDWFSSTEILLECLMAAIAFYVFVVHCLSAKAPFLNLRLLRDRNYAIGLALVTIYGMLNFTPMVLLPPLLQQYASFPDALVGQVIGCRGVGMLVGFMTAGFMSRIDPRISMAFGFGLQTAAGLWMLTFDLNVTMEILIANSAIQGFAVGVVWVPITAVAFGTLDARNYAEASAIFHLLRNIGSSFFISLSIAEIVRTTGANYSRMSEMITPFNPVLTMPNMTGMWDFSTAAGLAKFAA